MRIIICLLFLLKDFRNVFNRVHVHENFNLGELSSDLALSPSSSPNYSPHDKNNRNNAIRLPQTDSACNNECLDLQAEISDIFSTNQKQPIAYFFNKCGMITEGRLAKALLGLPFCYCYSPDEYGAQRKTRLLFCRNSMRMIRAFTKRPTTTANTILAKNTMHVEEVMMTEWGGKGRRSFTEQIPNLHPKLPFSPPKSPDPSPKTPAAPTKRYGGPPSDDAADSGCCGKSSAKRARYDSRPALPGAAWTYAGPNDSKRPGTSSSKRPQSKTPEPDRPSSNPRSRSFSEYARPPPDLGEEDFNTRPDDKPEGTTLKTYVRIDGEIVQAAVDTGSSFNIINPKYKGKVEPYHQRFFKSGNNAKISIEGITTIDIEIRENVFISLTGLVATVHIAEIFFGSPFYDTYKAVIRIPESIMELTVNEEQKAMRVRYRATSKEVGMTVGDHGRYTSLKVDSIVNGRCRMILVDTGTSKTVVNPGLVDLETLRKSSSRLTVGNTRGVDILATSKITIGLGGNLNPPLATVTQKALVPDFVPANPLVAGTDFIRRYVQVIDYDDRKVYFRFPDPTRQYVSFSVKMHIHIVS